MKKHTTRMLAILLGVSTIAANFQGFIVQAEQPASEVAGETQQQEGTEVQEVAPAESGTEVQEAAVAETGAEVQEAVPAEAAASTVETADVEDASAEELKENSWRYENGNPIPTIETYAKVENAWKMVNGSYINSVGDVIPGAMEKGIDVSEHQGKIDWEKVKADGIDFAILRCGYGDDYADQDDKFWQYNVSECERLGIPYGVYIYSYATNVEMAKSEAAHTLRLLQGHTPSYPVYYDLEENEVLHVGNKMLGEMATVYCDAIEGAGYKAGIYANLNWWSNHLTDPVFKNASWSKWVAQYNTTCDYGSKYDIWQCSSSEKVNGINGNVDINFLMESANPFYDVSWGSWCFDSVMYVNNNGYMTGMSEGIFGPSERTSRGQFTTILHRMSGSPDIVYSAKYPDVGDGLFFTKGTLWASQEDIVSGYENGSFGPADDMTREQMVTMMYRYAKSGGYDVSAVGDLSKFPDNGSVSEFALEAMKWAVGAGLVSGTGAGTLDPTTPIDRAACATIMMRYKEKVEKVS